MFTPTDRDKRAFVERTRAERQQREKERLEKETLAKHEQAAMMVQRWWRRRRRCHHDDGWMLWDDLVQTDAHDLMRIIGLYCLLSRQDPGGQESRRRLAVLCKTIKPAYYDILADPEQRKSAQKRLVTVIQHCLDRINEETYLTGPELTFLLQYLNPRHYGTSSPDSGSVLMSIAKEILEETLLRYDFNASAMDHIKQVVKLEERQQRSKHGLTSEDAKKLQGNKLWLTTLTRLTLFPTECFHLSQATWALMRLPLLPRMVPTQIADFLRKHLLPEEAVHWTPRQGNRILFFLANGVDVWQDKTDILINFANTLLAQIQPHFSQRQTPNHQLYHPLFRWTSDKEDLTDTTELFRRVTEQLQWLWSRKFMDHAFARILAFERPQTQSCNSKPASVFKARFLPRKTKQQQEQQQPSSAVYGQLAEFAMDVQILFRLYSRLAFLFADQRNVIFYRIAFTKKLMPQLWSVMNSFGPRGEMKIYLEAADKGAEALEKEPLIDVLKVFCTACSLVFLTVDETDIFINKTPFSPEDLIKISEFLNAFYFALVQSSDEKEVLMTYQAARRLLLQLHELDSRHSFCPAGHWLLVLDPSTKPSLLSLWNSNQSVSSNPFLERLRQGEPVSLRILQWMPHTIPFETRLKIFRDWITQDHVAGRGSRIVKVRRDHVLEDGFRGLNGMSPSAWKGNIRVQFVNELGVDEAGIDQGGPFKDFVSLLISEVFKPSFALFSSTENNLFYPASTSHIHGPHHVQLFQFVGQATVYEGILLDVQFASFVLAKLLGRNVFLEGLKELDEDLWRNLTFVKHYDGCVEDLGLTFATDEEEFGERVTHELKYGGKNVNVTDDNRVEYVYLMADYKLNRQTKEQTQAFVQGLLSLISDAWIKIFTPSELQRVISGEDAELDISDLRRHTEYEHGYFDQHPVIRMFWQIVEEFSPEEKRAFLKFVTSCPKPPLGGFDYLQPPFTVRMVSIDEGTVGGVGLVKTFLKINQNSKQGRLPTSSTCFNLLKLPGNFSIIPRRNCPFNFTTAYTKKSILKEKLRYAIHSNTGFELS
ncbi:Ubiquitin-protein ligase E3B [Apophysomyces ossiformis]|uniref:HECT-type E3 ubiquitin transferase n=1 Tax=Apophysomyces ossiformis TaxID=679940 RepID=A0A8H7BY06_9FUNG|nr:Ubiquitin-protein ligase E3B [Apophysomyces ossiformis]